MIKGKVEFMTSSRVGGVNAVEVSIHEGQDVYVIPTDKVKVFTRDQVMQEDHLEDWIRELDRQNKSVRVLVVEE